MTFLAVAASISACSETAPPTPSTAAPATEFVCDRDPDVFPEFEGEVLRSVAVRDVSGAFTECRWIGQDEATAILDDLEPPFPAQMEVGQVFVTQAVGRKNTLILFWAVANCDLDATLLVSTSVPNIQVTQRRTGACMGGTGPTWLQLMSESTITVAGVTAGLQYTEQ